jgi:homoserine O-acetyltransferase/O-succinyltransferase
MTKEVIVVSPEDPIELAARKIKKYGISSLQVVDDNGKHWNRNHRPYNHINN